MEAIDRQNLLARLIDKAGQIEDNYNFSKVQSIMYILNGDLKRIGLTEYEFGSFYLMVKDKTLADDLSALAEPRQFLDIGPGSRKSYDINKINASNFKDLEFHVLNTNGKLEDLIGKENLEHLESEFSKYALMPMDDVIRTASEIYLSKRNQIAS